VGCSGVSGYKTSALPSPRSGAPAAQWQRGSENKGQGLDLSKNNLSSAHASFVKLALRTFSTSPCNPFFPHQNDWWPTGRVTGCAVRKQRSPRLTEEEQTTEWPVSGVS